MTALRALAALHLVVALAGLIGAVVALPTTASGPGAPVAVVLLATCVPLLLLAGVALTAGTPRRVAVAGLATSCWTVAVLGLIWATQLFPFVLFLIVVAEIPALGLLLLPTASLAVLSARGLALRPHRAARAASAR